MVSLSDIRGLWRRRLIAWPQGEADTTTEVYWLQGPELYIDLRIPERRPRCKATCLRELDRKMLGFLARQEGFFGKLDVQVSVGHWHRAFDYQPDTGRKDCGHLAFEGDILVERGIEAPYIEHWVREPNADECMALSLKTDAPARTGCLILAGDAFMYARSRSTKLPPDADLTACLKAAGSLKRQQDIFDCEISFGRVQDRQWRIERSSLPFREGHSLRPHIEPGTGSLLLDDITTEGSAIRRIWQVASYESTSAKHLRQWLVPNSAAESASLGQKRIQPPSENWSRVMNKANFTELPVVDISGLLTADQEAAQQAADHLGHAAREVGFCYVAGHGIPQSVFAGVVDAATRFFALPVEEKMKVYIGLSRNHRGYVPEGEEVFAAGSKDRKEAYDLSIDLPSDDPDYLAGNPLLGPNQWPDSANFRTPVMTYYDAIFSLGRVLMGGFARALGEFSDFFDRYLTKPPSQLRLIHYPYNPTAGQALCIGWHTDYECLTLLYSTAPGLEVLNSAGRWIDAPPLPGALVVNIGDMMEIWTNGEFVATSHRVRPVKEERYSFPLFFAVDYDTEVKPLDRFVTEERPARAGLTAGEHLFAQTAQSFNYQKARLASGEITLPETYVPLSSFGQGAKYAGSDPGK
jgi:isopenicillin N synthase-like dioxygenase